jgi:hypothetical protein
MANAKVNCPKLPAPPNVCSVGTMFSTCGYTDYNRVRAGIWDAAGVLVHNADPTKHCVTPLLGGWWDIPFVDALPVTPAGDGPYSLAVEFGNGVCPNFAALYQVRIPIRVVSMPGPQCACVAPGIFKGLFQALFRSIRRILNWLLSLFGGPE